jgi:hypothetical protein
MSTIHRLLSALALAAALPGPAHAQTLNGFCYADTFQRPPMTTACPTGMVSKGADCVSVKPKADWVACGPGYAASDDMCKRVSLFATSPSAFRADYARQLAQMEQTFRQVTQADTDGVGCVSGASYNGVWVPYETCDSAGRLKPITTTTITSLDVAGVLRAVEKKAQEKSGVSIAQGEFVVAPCSLYGQPPTAPEPTLPVLPVAGTACKGQNWIVNNNDRVYADFSASAAPHGTVQAIPRGTVASNKGGTCQSVSWSDLNLTCSHGTWQVGGRWMAGERRIQWPNGMAWSQTAQRHKSASPTSPMALVGNWTAYGTNTQPGPTAASIKLLVDNGLGAPSALYTDGPGRPLVAEDWKVSAELAQNGQRINWGNGTYWVKQPPRGGAPRGPLGVEGEWQAFDASGKAYPKLASIYWLLDAGGGAKTSMAEISGTAIMAPGWNLVGSVGDTNVCQSSYTPSPNLKVVQ